MARHTSSTRTSTTKCTNVWVAKPTEITSTPARIDLIQRAESLMSMHPARGWSLLCLVAAMALAIGQDATRGESPADKFLFAGGDTMYVGVDYYPEHWPEERWETDLQMMRDAGFNVVRVAEFSWVL